MRDVKRISKAQYKTSSILMGAAAAAFFPFIAHAQETIANPPPAQDQQAADDADDSIVVTGTRIRTEFNSPSPIQVITTETSTQAGINDVGEMVRNSSVAAGSFQIDSKLSSAFVTQGGPGSDSVSLRGLGANRTLVLLNGRRAGPAGTRGEVAAFDLNVVPLAIVDRVEVLKDGASSIYGSDAVAGVVNIITNSNLDHGIINLDTSVPFEEGGEEISGDVAWGHRFSRGHILSTLSYSHQEEVTYGQRGYTDCAVDYTFSLATGQRNDVINPLTGQPACRGNTPTGVVWLYDLSGNGQFADGPNFIQYDPSGRIGELLPQTLLPQSSPGGALPGTPTTPNGNYFNVNFDRVTSGAQAYNSEAERNSSFAPDLSRVTAYVEGSFDLTNNIEAYGEVLLNRRESKTNGFRQIWTYVYTSEAGDPFSTGWDGVGFLSPTVVTDHSDASQTVDYRRFVGGLRGDFDAWMGPAHWDIYLQDSRSDGAYTDDVILADAVYSSDGRSDFGTVGLFHENSIPRPTATCVGYMTPVSNRPCVDVNWLSPQLLSGGGFTPEEQQFLFDRETGHTIYQQRSVEASITTDLFALPAGNVAGAFGLTYRTDEIKDTPGAVTLAGNSWNSTGAGITQGDDTTSEAFAEVNIPILADQPFANRLDLVLSGRYTDVDSYGSNSTYKVGLTWALTDELTFRYTKGTSFRAPALFELYLAEQTGFLDQRVVDPCILWGDNLDLGNITERVAANCDADGVPEDYNPSGGSVTVTSSGGAGRLKAETSDAQVFGIIYQPHWTNLSIALDFFEINVNDEVSQLGASSIVFGCYDSTSFPTDPLCSLFARGQPGDPLLIDTVTDSFLNVNSQINRGVDLTARWEHAFDFGRFSIQGQFSYQTKDITALFEGTDESFNGTAGEPKVVGNVDFQLVQGPWTYFWRVNYIGHTDDSSLVSPVNPGADIRYVISAEDTYYHDVSIQREFSGWKLLAGISNLFDQEPPQVSTSGAAGQFTIGPSLRSSQYDYLGRRGFIRFSTEF